MLTIFPPEIVERIPTLSFAYSIKARGINRDVFGHTEYYMEPADLDVSAVVSKITAMLDKDLDIRNELTARIPNVQEAAIKSGMILKQLIEGD